MIDDVLAQPHQIGDALWRIESAGIPRRSLPGGVAVCGPAGGAGALAALAGADAHDGLPAGEDTFVLCASYSGDDEEALDAFEEAGKRGAPRAVVCTAGALAARAREEGVPVVGVPAGLPDGGAIVYFLLAALSCAGFSVTVEAEPASALLQRLAAEWGPDAPDDSLAKSIARRVREGEDVTVEAAGETPLQRVLAGVFQGDLVAAYVASPDA